MRYLREIQLEVHMSIYKMLINCSPSLAWGYVNAGFLLLQWELFQAKGCDIIHLSIDIFKEGLQCNRCSINAGEFHTNLIWSYDEKLTEMHSTLCNLLFPTSHFPISSQKEYEERKRKEREDQRKAARNGCKRGRRGTAQVRAASNFHNQRGLNSMALGPRQTLWSKAMNVCSAELESILGRTGDFPLKTAE